MLGSGSEQKDQMNVNLLRIFNSDKKSKRKESENEINPFQRNNTGGGSNSNNRTSLRKGLPWDK